MVERAGTLEILLIQHWIHDLEPIRAAIGEVGAGARWTRVDIEPALHAALTRDTFDLVIYAAPPSLSLASVEECLRATRCTIPVVAADPIATLAERVRDALQDHRN